MPVKNRIKSYAEGAVYHIYSRGLDEREVFVDEADFLKYESILKEYLEGKIETKFKERPYIVKRKEEMNLKQEVVLLAYCLMPTCLHLLVRQNDERGITKLMRRVGTTYVMYFNKRHGRRGQLFDGTYKAVKVDSKNQIVHLTRLIHLKPGISITRRFGPVATTSAMLPEQYLYSSWQKKSWVASEEVKKIWREVHDDHDSFENWVSDQKVNSWEVVGELMME